MSFAPAYGSEQYWQNEIDFWGIHRFRDVWSSMGCGTCGNGYHDPVHTEEAADCE